MSIQQFSKRAMALKHCAHFSNLRKEEAAIATVYNTGGSLMAKLLNALKDQGVDLDLLKPDSLTAVDQFHIGGLKGFSRHLSQKYSDCSVHGIDLTPDYIDVCEKLTMMTGIKNATFELGSASALPGPDSHYDIACMLHVGMNIKDKSNIFQQLQRVLKEGGTFAIYDVMKSTGSKDQPLTYPVPWANDESQSFVEDSETYIQAANAHGFRLISNLPRKEFAVKFFAPLLERLKNNRKMPAFSLAILFGEEYAEKKMYNLIDMILSDVVVPVELIFKKE